MNNDRISELYGLLAEEARKIPQDEKRIKEINHYLSKELGTAPKAPTGTVWTYLSGLFTLPDDWKIYATAAVGAFIAFNSVLNIVPANWQNALLAVAISLGFWTINGTQNLNLLKTKAHIDRNFAKLRTTFLHNKKP